jgi:hypothetical protein
VSFGEAKRVGGARARANGDVVRKQDEWDEWDESEMWVGCEGVVRSGGDGPYGLNGRGGRGTDEGTPIFVQTRRSRMISAVPSGL